MITKQCQNCRSQFIVEDEDLAFYKKMDVPAPTWCPECRMVRRMIWRNERNLYRRPESQTGELIFSTFHQSVPFTVYDRDFWWSDQWDPMKFGRDYDFSRPFFEQLKKLIYEVPWPSRSALNLVNSQYSNNLADAKNAYLCFNGTGIENSAYVVGFTRVTEGFDLYQSRHTELCYDCYMVDESNKVFFSTNVEDSHDVWFSKNMVGCSNCFGCMNLRNKSYHIFNKPVSRGAWQEFMKTFNSGSYAAIEEMRRKAETFWQKYPHRFTLAINVVNSTGEHIEHTKNVRNSYFVHDSEDLRYCQLVENTKDSYDFTIAGRNAELLYESVVCAFDIQMIKFSLLSLSGSNNTEYCVNSSGSSNLFACSGLQKKQYCIFNKQYSKEEYASLRRKIIEHMDKVPYADKQGRVYKYGEFFPPEFSPFAYNETLAQDFSPLTKEEALAKGFTWRDEEAKKFKLTKKAADLPDNIKDVNDDIVNEIIGCSSCGKAYRIIPMELDFYRRITLPLPHLCSICRFARRFKLVNPPKLWEGKCQCNGRQSAKREGQSVYTSVYTNEVKHFHGDQPCPNTFQTSYAPGRSEIVYCERCYQQETI